MEIVRLDSTLGAVVTEVELTSLSDDEWTQIEHAFHEHAVLVFPGQHLSSSEQIAFARRFGDIEVLFEGYDAVPISTVDQTGEVMAPDHPVMQVVRGNQGWHTDSSYMPVSAKASMLSARVVPASGGETEWADMRAAFDALDPVTRERIADLSAYHSIAYSQAQAGFESNIGYGMDEPAQLRPLVKVHPVTGRPALFIGRHAHAIPGLSAETSPTSSSPSFSTPRAGPPGVPAPLAAGRPRRVGQPVRVAPCRRMGPRRASRDGAHPRRR